MASWTVTVDIIYRKRIEVEAPTMEDAKMEAENESSRFCGPFGSRYVGSDAIYAAREPDEE